MMMNSNASNYASTNKCHAIDRSTELLSVARTALCIAQQQTQQEEQSNDMIISSTNNNKNAMTMVLLSLQPSDLSLHNGSDAPNGNESNIIINNTAKELLSEAVLTLHHLDETLKKLSMLVKRRGHTNDPTNDINVAMCDFQSFVKDILEIIDKTLPQAAMLPLIQVVSENSSSQHEEQQRQSSRKHVSSSSHRRKHYDRAAKLLKSNVEERMEKFKQVMKVRGDVIKDLTMRRNRLLKTNNQSNKNGSGGGGDQNILKNNITLNNNTHLPPQPQRQLNISNGRIGGPPKTGLKMEPKQVKSQLNSPLFTMSNASSKLSNPYGGSGSGGGGGMNNKGPSINRNKNSMGNPYSTNGSTALLSEKYGAKQHVSSVGYGVGSNKSNNGGHGYGGYNNISNATGMRHRGGNMNSGPTMNINSRLSQQHQQPQYNPYQMDDEIKVHDGNDSEQIQSQIQKRRQVRQTQSRLESAKMAEKTLAELTTMFGKMSNLIQSQGETLEKIEDDVEVAMGYVDDGHEEVGKLHQFKQGNRGLIIKCFGILIFLIIFMKYYG